MNAASDRSGAQRPFFDAAGVGQTLHTSADADTAGKPTSYAEFLRCKTKLDPDTGLKSFPELPSQLFPFQHDIVSWALRRGRAAVFAQTGLGKSFIELAWGRAIHQETGGNVLLLTPLAVAAQMVREAAKFGLPAKQCASQADVEPGITVTNYAKLHHFDLSKFVGVILDESSILKAFDGKTRTMLIERCKDVPFRLAATATPAPNDFTELGNHAEFLGVMSLHGMQATFFTHDASDTGTYRLKGHAEQAFWQWMCSWSVLLRNPSDLGYEDGAYALPPLQQVEHVIPVDGERAITLSQRLRARRESLEVRVAKAVAILKENGWIDRSTCVSGTNAIESTCATTGGAEPKSGTPHAAASTQPTLNTADGQRQALGDEILSQSATAGSEARLESTAPSGTQCSPHKVADAPSAERLTETAAGDGSPSTIATPPEWSADSCAPTAIRASASSETTLHGSSERPSTAARPWVIWCNLNAESEALAAAIPGAVEVRGSDSEDVKERKLRDFSEGRIEVLISKPSLSGFGMNWQHCADTIFVGLNDSFEQVYQAVRRFWRYGQTRPVTAHFIAASTEGAVLENLRRKEADAERMACAMVAEMADLSSALVHGASRQTDNYNPTQPVRLPRWLQEAA